MGEHVVQIHLKHKQQIKLSWIIVLVCFLDRRQRVGRNQGHLICAYDRYLAKCDL